MTDSNVRHFVTLAELEFAAGAAAFADGKVTLSHLSLQQAQEFENVTNDLRKVLAGGSAVSQAGIPVQVASLKGVDTSTPDAAARALSQQTGLRPDELSVVLLDPASGKPILTPHAGEPLAVCMNRRDISAKRSQINVLSPNHGALTCRFFNNVTALKKRLAAGQFDKPVLYVDAYPKTCEVVVLTADDIVPVGSIGAGTDIMLEQVMTVLGLMFKGSAARLFNGDVYDFTEHAWKLVSPHVKALTEKLQVLQLPQDGCYLHLTGVPLSRQGILTKPLAERMGMQPLFPFVDMEASGAALPDYFASGSLDLWHLIASDPENADEQTADIGNSRIDWAGIARECHAMAQAPTRYYRGLAYGGAPQAIAAKTKEKDKDEAKAPARRAHGFSLRDVIARAGGIEPSAPAAAAEPAKEPPAERLPAKAADPADPKSATAPKKRTYRGLTY